MKKREVGYQKDKCHVRIDSTEEDKFVASEKFRGQHVIFYNLGPTCNFDNLGGQATFFDN